MIAVTNSSKVFSLYFRNKNDDRCMIDTNIQLYKSPYGISHSSLHNIYYRKLYVCNAKGTLHHNHYLISSHNLLML